jgi:hypothetical protein
VAVLADWLEKLFCKLIFQGYNRQLGRCINALVYRVFCPQKIYLVFKSSVEFRLSKFAKLGKSLKILSELGFVGFYDLRIMKNNV